MARNPCTMFLWEPYISPVAVAAHKQGFSAISKTENALPGEGGPGAGHRCPKRWAGAVLSWRAHSRAKKSQNSGPADGRVGSNFVPWSHAAWIG